MLAAAMLFSEPGAAMFQQPELMEGGSRIWVLLACRGGCWGN